MNEVKQEQTIKKIVIIYKEPGKNPDLIKVQNSDEEFKKILGGEITKIDLGDSYIVYLKDSDRLKANVFVRTGTNSMGINVKGTLLLVGRDELSGKIIGLTRNNVGKYASFLIQRAFDYSNQDENGRFLSRREMRQREMQKLKERKDEVMNSIRERMGYTSKVNENQKIETKDDKTSNLPPEDKKQEKEEFDENAIRIELAPETDNTPDEKKNRIYLDAEIVNCLKAMTYILSEIRIELHKKL